MLRAQVSNCQLRCSNNSATPGASYDTSHTATTGVSLGVSHKTAASSVNLQRATLLPLAPGNNADTLSVRCMLPFIFYNAAATNVSVKSLLGLRCQSPALRTSLLHGHARPCPEWRRYPCSPQQLGPALCSGGPRVACRSSP